MKDVLSLSDKVESTYGAKIMETGKNDTTLLEAAKIAAFTFECILDIKEVGTYRNVMNTLKAAIDCHESEIDELRKENETLKAHVERLRNHLIGSGSSQWWVDEASRIIKETPQQSLAAIENETLEKVAREVEDWDSDSADPREVAEAIRAMKKEP